MAPLQRIVELALDQCLRFITGLSGTMDFETILVDFDGNVLARAARTGMQPTTPITPPPPLIERLPNEPLPETDEPVEDV
jgi:cobalt-precorrin-5B (C1)-methyltransferase